MPDSTPKFTPGDWIKWRLAPSSDLKQRCIITTADGETEISGIIYREADADLFAASKDMYGVLKAVEYDSDRTSGPDIVLSRGRLQKVLDAIAKVEGRA